MLRLHSGIMLALHLRRLIAWSYRRTKYITRLRMVMVVVVSLIKQICCFIHVFFQTKLRTSNQQLIRSIQEVRRFRSRTLVHWSLSIRYIISSGHMWRDLHSTSCLVVAASCWFKRTPMCVSLRCFVQYYLAVLIPATWQAVDSFSGKQNIIELASSSDPLYYSYNILCYFAILLQLEA